MSIILSRSQSAPPLRQNNDRVLNGTNRIDEFTIENEDIAGKVLYMPTLYSSPKWHVLTMSTGTVVLQEIHSGRCSTIEKDKIRAYFKAGILKVVPPNYRV